jgi:hypothetical protein
MTIDLYRKDIRRKEKGRKVEKKKKKIPKLELEVFKRNSGDEGRYAEYDPSAPASAPASSSASSSASRRLQLGTEAGGWRFPSQ